MKLLRFEVGAFGPAYVRQEAVALGLPRPVRLVYASDLHLGHWWTRGVPAQLLLVARQTRPDAVLLGGDLVDGPEALPALRECVRALADLALVGAVPGNHDQRAGLEQVRDGVPAGSVSVAFATADGTAVAGTDYVSTAATLLFAPGV